ncbi:MAG: T9SS C-terminal target domain-containing protein, partial [Ignavibacteriales bacterium]
STKINFSLPKQSYVDLTVYDILGNEITRLVSDNYSAGEYSVDFNADNLPAGVYMARISAGKYSHTVKMVLLK